MQYRRNSIPAHHKKDGSRSSGNPENDELINEVLGILDLFNGQLSFEEIYNMPMNLARRLKNSKTKLEQAKQQKLNDLKNKT
jgi:hypothetical protein